MWPLAIIFGLFSWISLQIAPQFTLFMWEYYNVYPDNYDLYINYVFYVLNGIGFVLSQFFKVFEEAKEGLDKAKAAGFAELANAVQNTEYGLKLKKLHSWAIAIYIIFELLIPFYQFMYMILKTFFKEHTLDMRSIGCMVLYLLLCAAARLTQRYLKLVDKFFVSVVSFYAFLLSLLTNFTTNLSWVLFLLFAYCYSAMRAFFFDDIASSATKVITQLQNMGQLSVTHAPMFRLLYENVISYHVLSRGYWQPFVVQFITIMVMFFTRDKQVVTGVYLGMACLTLILTGFAVANKYKVLELAGGQEAVEAYRVWENKIVTLYRELRKQSVGGDVC
jgi:hypothetical protein